MWTKLKRWLAKLRFGFFSGMKSAEEVFSGTDERGVKHITINESQHENRVSTDLLQGKETQQTREIRYRTYMVDRESKKYEYFSPYLSRKRTTPKKCPNVCDRSDGRNIIVIQDNFFDGDTVLEGLEQIDRYGDRTKTWIHVSRDGNFTPRFRIEDYTLRVVVKEGSRVEIGVVEFYVSKYPDKDDMKSRGFISEVRKMLGDAERQSDITNITGIDFVTRNAFGCEDMIKFQLTNPILLSIGEFDGDYVFRFKARFVVNGHDIVDEYYEKSIADKYANKEARKRVVSMTGHEEVQEYTCEGCGKVVTYDTRAIDEAHYNGGTNVAEYLDLQIAKETVGKYLCKDCLNKMVNDMDLWTTNNMHS